MATTTHHHELSGETGNVLYDSLMSASIGGSAVALFYLVIDIARGEPFFTPSVLGTALFSGVSAAAVSDVSLSMAAAYTVVHFAVFGALGTGAALLVHKVEKGSDPILMLLALFVAFEVGFVAFSATIMPGVIESLGAVRVAFANLLAAGGMAAYLLHFRHIEEWKKD
jgi:hypothetical protein